jgi:hypothetical protein
MHNLFPPLSFILEWPPANYTDPPLRFKAVLITACILAPLTLLIVGARTWARAYIQRNFGLDDWLMVASMIPTMALAVVVCLATERFNFDRHIWDVLPTMYVDVRKITFVCYLLYIVSGEMIKISILLFDRRLDSRSITKTFRVATWMNIIAIAVFFLRVRHHTVHCVRSLDRVLGPARPHQDTQVPLPGRRSGGSALRECRQRGARCYRRFPTHDSLLEPADPAAPEDRTGRYFRSGIHCLRRCCSAHVLHLAHL